MRASNVFSETSLKSMSRGGEREETCLMFVVFLCSTRMISTFQRSGPETNVSFQPTCCCSVSLLLWSVARKCCSSQVSCVSLPRCLQSCGTERKDSCPHHHQSKSFHDPAMFVKSRCQFLSRAIIQCSFSVEGLHGDMMCVFVAAFCRVWCKKQAVAAPIQIYGSRPLVQLQLVPSAFTEEEKTTSTQLTVSVLLLCRLCALVASSSLSPIPSPRTTLTVTTTDGGGWPWRTWFW